MNLKNNIMIAARRLLKKTMWSGDFTTWQDAVNKTTGYSSAEILERVKTATLKVKNGEAVYERDSVLFDKVEYSWPLLSALMWIAAKNKGSLKVLDFGGSLGTSFFQNRRFLDTLERVEWCIVEQENFVVTGRQYIEDKKLQFFYSIGESIAGKGVPDILVLSGSLPFLEKPYEIIKEILGYKIPHLFIGNTFFNYEERDRITVQNVFPYIYPASYPCWFLSYKSVIELVTAKYDIVTEHLEETYITLDGHPVRYKGFLAELK